jgi:hypothetical protein
VENSTLPEQRIDSQGITAEHMNPVDSLETVGQLLRPLDVAQPHERIVELHVLDVVTIELPSQPLVAVDVDLDLKREPTLELDVDEPQVSVQEVVVEVETLRLVDCTYGERPFQTSENVRHGSSTDNTHTRPSVISSRSAIFRARSSFLAA